MAVYAAYKAGQIFHVQEEDVPRYSDTGYTIYKQVYQKLTDEELATIKERYAAVPAMLSVDVPPDILDLSTGTTMATSEQDDGTPSKFQDTPGSSTAF